MNLLKLFIMAFISAFVIIGCLASASMAIAWLIFDLSIVWKIFVFSLKLIIVSTILTIVAIILETIFL